MTLEHIALLLLLAHGGIALVRARKPSGTTKGFMEVGGVDDVMITWVRTKDKCHNREVS